MTPALLDVVVLARDLPDQGLRRGDLGTVVELPEAIKAVILAMIQGAG